MKPVSVKFDPELKEFIRKVSAEGRTSWEELREAELAGDTERLEMAIKFRAFIAYLDMRIYGRILSEEESLLLIAKKKLHTEIEV